MEVASESAPANPGAIRVGAGRLATLVGSGGAGVDRDRSSRRSGAGQARGRYTPSDEAAARRTRPRLGQGRTTTGGGGGSGQRIAARRGLGGDSSLFAPGLGSSRRLVRDPVADPSVF